MGNDPIYIVDGALRDDLSGVNPNDIESMEVLEGRRFGRRSTAHGASNGVIIVTTKKGSRWQGAPGRLRPYRWAVRRRREKWDLHAVRAKQIALVRPAIANSLRQVDRARWRASSWLDGANVAVGTGNTVEQPNQFTTRYLEYGGTVPDRLSSGCSIRSTTSKVIIFTDTDLQDQWFSEAFWQKEYIGVNGRQRQD